MKKTFLILILILLAFNSVNAQDWVWAKQFSSNGNVNPLDIVVGSDDNIYVAGQYSQALTIGSTTLPYSDLNGKDDIFLCSFASNGDLRWARQIGGDHMEEFGGIAVDDNNNIYLVGSSRSSTLYFPPSATTLTNVLFDAFLAKYDNDGNLVLADSIFWGSEAQRLKDVAVDFSSNLLIFIGNFKTELKYYDGAEVQTINVLGIKDNLVARYDLNGQFHDILVFKNSAQETAFKTVNNCVYGGNVQGYFVSGDLKGKLYLPGNDTLSGDELKMDAMLIRFDNDLEYLWSRHGGGTAFDHVNSSFRDDNGNIYVAGKCESNPITFDSTATLISVPIAGFGGSDYYLIKYNRNGYLQWIRRKGGTGTDNAYGMAYKSSRIVTSGNIAEGSNINSGFDLYNVNGSFIVGDIITGDAEDQGQGVAFNSSADSIFVTGYFKSTILNAGPLTLNNTVAGNQDGFLVKYGYKFKIFLDEKTNIKCNGSSDGYIKVGTQFGVEPITYTWNPNVSTTLEASGLVAGTFRIIATDNSGKKDTIDVIITEPAAITITTNLLQDVTCYGGEDGEIRVAVSGGTSPYTLTWSGPDNLIQNNTIQTGLISGTYKLVVLDANGCTTEKIFNVDQPSKITFTGSSVNGITVPPGCNGAVNLTVTGGTPAYTYDWEGPSGYSSTSGTITGLCLGGDYDLEVTDSKLCIQDTTFSVPVDTGLNIMICEKTNISCTGEENGQAKVCVIQGGTGSYTYAWRTSGGTPVGGNDPELSDVSKGTYYVKVTDNGNGKFAETSVKIEEPVTPLTTVFAEVRDISCYGKNNGYINLSVSYGWGGYKYHWDPRGDTTQDVSYLTKGEWIVTITDAGGCVKQLNTSINEPGEIIVSNISVYDSISCYGDSDGSLWAHVAGGTKPYAYFWDDDGFQNDSIATDLIARIYSVNIIDARGCKAIKAFKELVEPFELTIDYSKTNVKCKGGNDGSITLSPTDGTTPYTYLWDDGPVTKDRASLLPGKYCVTVSDYHGCTAYQCIDINEPSTSVSIDSTKTVDVNCFGGADGIITVYASGGTGIHTYTITPGGTSNETGVFENLPIGDFTVEVKDENLCSAATDQIPIEQPDIIGIYISNWTPVSCNGGSDGSITFDNFTGGTPPYSCAWDDGPTTCNRTDLLAGEYTLTVTDAHGCTEDSLIIIWEPDPLIFFAIYIDSASNAMAADGRITLTPGGGTPPYKYFINNNPEPDSIISDLVASDYVVRIEDANNCSTPDSTVNVPVMVGMQSIQDFGKFFLYPNPTTGKLTVEIEARNHKDINLEIVNLRGQVIWKKDLQYNGQPRFIEVIDMSRQAKGTYFMRVNGLPVHTKILLE